MKVKVLKLFNCSVHSFLIIWFSERDNYTPSWLKGDSRSQPSPKSTPSRFSGPPSALSGPVTHEIPEWRKALAEKNKAKRESDIQVFHSIHIKSEIASTWNRSYRIAGFFRGNLIFANSAWQRHQIVFCSFNFCFLNISHFLFSRTGVKGRRHED